MLSHFLPHRKGKIYPLAEYSCSWISCCCLLTRFCKPSISRRRAFSMFPWVSVAALISLLNQILGLMATPPRALFFWDSFQRLLRGYPPYRISCIFSPILTLTDCLPKEAPPPNCDPIRVGRNSDACQAIQSVGF